MTWHQAPHGAHYRLTDHGGIVSTHRTLYRAERALRALEYAPQLERADGGQLAQWELEALTARTRRALEERT